MILDNKKKGASVPILSSLRIARFLSFLANCPSTVRRNVVARTVPQTNGPPQWPPRKLESEKRRKGRRKERDAREEGVINRRNDDGQTLPPVVGG